MKSNYLVKNGGDSTNSLPPIIRMLQYNDNWFKSNSNIKNDLVNRKIETPGYIGNGYLDMCADFTCAPIIPGSDEDEFKAINNVLLTTKYPTFRKEIFDKDYLIFETVDYGHQSMTMNYMDFVPQVFVNGQKIWQKYIGLIRVYSSKKAWVIIKKSNNIHNSDYEYKTSDIFQFRFVFKTNIEKGDLNKTEYPFKKDTDGKFKIKNTDFIFSSDTLDDYDLFVKNTKSNNLTQVDSKNFYFKIEAVNDNEYAAVETQNKKNSEKHIEYFRQSFINDYTGDNSNDNDEIIRKLGKNGKTLLLDTSYPLNNDEIFVLKTKQHNYNAEYKQGEKIGVNSDCMIFSKNGYRVSKLNPKEYYEIVPEYTSFRKYEFPVAISTEDQTLSALEINNLLFSYYIFPYNIDASFTDVLVFEWDEKKENMSLKYINENDAELEANKNYNIIVYDTNKLLENTENIKESILYSASNVNNIKWAEQFTVNLEETIESFSSDPYQTTNKDFNLNDQIIIANSEDEIIDNKKLRLNENEITYYRGSNGLTIKRKDAENVISYDKNPKINLDAISENGIYNLVKTDKNYENFQKNIIFIFLKSSSKLYKRISKDEIFNNVSSSDIIFVEFNSDTEIAAYCETDSNNILTHFEIVPLYLVENKRYACLKIIKNSKSKKIKILGLKEQNGPLGVYILNTENGGN